VNDFAPGLERALLGSPAEAAYEIDRTGAGLPAWLRGTYCLVGPGRFARGAQRYTHWLDGDGFVCAVRFDGSRARVAQRFVRTAKTIDEEAAGRALYRGFGTRFDGDRLNRGVALMSPVNVSVTTFAGRLLAFGEQGMPVELDPQTLATRGPFGFNNALTDLTPFSAHPRRDPASGSLVNFGISFAAEQPTLNLFAFDDTARLTARRRVALDLPRSVHDFALTERHAVFHLGPYLLDAAAIAGGCTVMEALSWRPELGSRLLVVTRMGEHVASIPDGSCYCLHVVNGFDRGGETVVDVIEYERPLYEEYQHLPDLFSAVGPGRPVRLVIDPAAGAVRERIPAAYSSAPDFPAIDPDLTARPYSECWMLGISATGMPGRKFFDELVRIDWSSPDRPEVYRLPAGRFFAGEPAFVRGPDSADDVVICPVCDLTAGRTTIGLFRARGLDPIGELPLRDLLPPLFHSTFAAAI
jgi:all-trans-8'-apo-beta-carotenal 15,15'-oxygenase